MFLLIETVKNDILDEEMKTAINVNGFLGVMV